MILEKLREDFKTAMKTRDAFSLGILRMIMSACNNRKIEKRGKGLPEELSDEEAREILTKQLKQRLDAAALFTTGGREDLAATERAEAAFIARYLPAQMTREEIVVVVDAVIARSVSKEFGAVMKEAMGELKGVADGKTVGEVIREKLG